VMNDVSPKVHDIAIVFQNNPLYPDMTVGNNMAFTAGTVVRVTRR
jgi:ABC-type sugar transport system ATPase subunit